MIQTTGTLTRKQLARFGSARFSVTTNLDAFCRAGQRGDLPYAVVTATQDIGYALETGRLPGAADKAIRGLRHGALCALVVDVAAACSTISEVPRFLIDRFA